MAARLEKFALVAMGVLVCATGALARQEPAGANPTTGPKAGPPEKLVGQWVFDDDESIEDQRNWRRPVGSGRPAVLNPTGNSGVQRTPSGMGSSIPTPQGVRRYPTANMSFDSAFRRTLRDLLEIAESYAIKVEDGRATVTDDLDRALVFTLNGRKEKHRLAATEFEARSTWDGVRLALDVEAYGGFRMSQVFQPSEDGQALFVAMVVQKPKFTPPIKNITRVYRRATSSTPASLNASARSRHLLQRPH
jgi:hypothetical protein